MKQIIFVLLCLIMTATAQTEVDSLFAVKAVELTNEDNFTIPRFELWCWANHETENLFYKAELQADLNQGLNKIQLKKVNFSLSYSRYRELKLLIGSILNWGTYTIPPARKLQTFINASAFFFQPHVFGGHLVYEKGDLIAALGLVNGSGYVDNNQKLDVVGRMRLLLPLGFSSSLNFQRGIQPEDQGGLREIGSFELAYKKGFIDAQFVANRMQRETLPDKGGEWLRLTIAPFQGLELVGQGERFYYAEDEQTQLSNRDKIIFTISLFSCMLSVWIKKEKYSLSLKNFSLISTKNRDGSGLARKP